MKYWKQVEEDAFKYYGGFSKEKARQIMPSVPELSTFTINGVLVDRNEFIKKCACDIKTVFIETSSFKDYKFYLIANVEILDRNSRIEKYKKVWKALQNKWSLNEFIKGEEIELLIGDNTVYSSIAEFNLENLSIALDIVANKPRMFTIISSNRSGLLTEKSIQRTFNILFNETDKQLPSIDYLNLCLQYCSDEDIVLRWGDSSEEITVGLIFKANYLKEFNK
mgnify:CR=1 FL=1